MSIKVLYKSLFIVFLFVLSTMPSVELAIVCSSLVLLLSLLFYNNTFDKYTFNLLILLITIAIIGGVASLLKSYKFIDFVRDLSHFTKPILMILTGFLMAKVIDNVPFLIKSIIKVALLLAIIHLFMLLININLSDVTLSEVRNAGGYSSFIELFALVFLIASKKYKIFNVIKSKFYKKLILSIISISFILYFSRTMFAGFLLFFLAIYGYAKLSAKGFKYAFIVLSLIVGFYVILINIKINPDNPGLENFFYKIKNSPSEMFSSPDGYNPSKHKNIFDRWRAYEAKLAIEQMEGNYSNYLIGRGFGSLIDLGFNAPLNENGLRYIPHIHNGYVYVFFKTGFVGLFLYIVLIISLYVQSYKNSYSIDEKAIRNLISGIGLYYILTSLIITGIYNLLEISTLLLGVLLFILKSTRKQVIKTI